jgi:hypothetical protein
MKRFHFAAVALVSLALAACGGSLGLPDLGDILGSGSATDRSDIRGYVERIDTSNRTITLNVTQVNRLRTDQSGQVIYYDNNTVVEYQGRQYRVEDLERGDEVAVSGSNVSGRYVAQRIVVTRNVRS